MTGRRDRRDPRPSVDPLSDGLMSAAFGQFFWPSALPWERAAGPERPQAGGRATDEHPGRPSDAHAAPAADTWAAVRGATGDAGPTASAEVSGAPDGEAGPVSKRPKRKGRTITASMDGSVLRVVLFSGDTVNAWASLDLDRGEDLELPAVIREALAAGAKQVCDLPFYAPLLRYMERPNVKKRFLNDVVTTELSETIPFELNEVDLHWKTVQPPHPRGLRAGGRTLWALGRPGLGRPEANGHGAEVVATAVPRSALDSHVGLLEAMGFRPSAAYAKATAIARAGGHPSMIAAHLTRGAAELVLVRDSVPRAVHRADLPDPSKVHAYAAALAQAVEEIAESEAPGAPSPDSNDGTSSGLPVVLTGAVPPGNTLAEALEETFDDRLHPARLPAVYPPGFPLEYAVNAGLLACHWAALKKADRDSPAGQVTIDLLPERHRHVRGISLRQAAAALGAVALVLLAAGATFGVNEVKAMNEAFAAQIDTLERQARASRNATGQISAARAELSALTGLADTLAEHDRALRDNAAALLDDLDTAISPENLRVTVSSVSLGGGILRVSGQVRNNADLVEYAAYLRGTGLFSNVEIARYSTASDGRVAFDISGGYPQRDPFAPPRG